MLLATGSSMSKHHSTKWHKLAFFSLLMLSAYVRAEAQPRGVLMLRQPAREDQTEAEWNYDLRDDGRGITSARRIVARGDSVCIVIPNAHPVFYNYSIKPETLKVETSLPQAPLLLVLSQMDIAKFGRLPTHSGAQQIDSTWFFRYVAKLNKLSEHIAAARQVAANSDTPENGDGKSNYRLASDSIKALLIQIPNQKSGETLAKLISRWHDEAEAEMGRQSLESSVGLAAIRNALGELPEERLKAARKNEEILIGNLRTVDQSLLVAIDAYADALLKSAESLRETWSGAGSTYKTCVGIGNESVRLQVFAAAKDTVNGKKRRVGKLTEMTIVPRYAEDAVKLSAMFTVSLTGQGEPDYQLRDGVVVNLGDDFTITPRPAAFLSGKVRQTGEDGSIIWRVGLGSSLGSTGVFERLFGVLSVGYRDLIGVGLGAGRVRRQRLADESILGKPLPAGKTIADYLREPENRPAFYLTFNLAGVDVLGALGKVLDGTK